MPVLSQADNSVLARWWRTVDHPTLFAITALIGFGYIMMLAASPAVAERIHQSRDIFIAKQVVFLALAGAIVVATSLLSPRGVRRLAMLGCLGAMLLTLITLIHGVEIKGARRWISVPGMTVQPSEFLKPCFAVVTAWLLSEAVRTRRFPGRLIACAVFTLIALLLKSQPDMGMLAVIGAVFFVQLFIGGLNLALVGIAGGGIVAAAMAAYSVFPHVRSRVTRFLHPESGDSYQVDKALEAFGNGGLLGRGPGEGRVKDVLPDAHADFVFAVMGEEFGLVICLLVLGIFGFIVIRGLLRLLGEEDLFIVLAATGLVTSFGLQSFVNMASSLHLIPTKGMTLPFVSYGGSSVMAVALGIGMLLALTRTRTRTDESPDESHTMRGDPVHPILIAAGGTGGHFFPAEALAAELIARGHRVALMTDARSGALTSTVFQDRETHILKGAGIAGRGPLRAAKSAIALAAGTVQARRLLDHLNPSIIIGFGGYPSVPPILAARLTRNRPKIVLHEQNAVLGRANRFLARFADTLALSLPQTTRLPRNKPAAITGNPIRPEVQALAATPYRPPSPDAPIDLLITGGSLGARILSDAVPPAIALLPPSIRARLQITQQCRPEDLARVQSAYAALAIPAELAPFFPDLPTRMAKAHLVIARAGASTVAEIAAIGRPALLIPLPGAIDDHQAHNAASIGAEAIRQSDLTPTLLAEKLTNLLTSPDLLAMRAHAIATHGRPKAAAELADLVEKLTQKVPA